MEQQQQHTSDLFSGLSLDHTARQHIRSIASWAMTLVVVAVVGYAFSIFELISRPKQVYTPASEGFDMGLKMVNNGNAFWTALMIAVGLLINYFLYRFASQARTGLDGLNQAQLNSSFNNLKAYFMAYSIIMIIVFVIVLLLVTFSAVSSTT